jgi:putative transposase
MLSLGLSPGTHRILNLNSFLAELPKFVEIVAYCLNSNHYHLLLKQLQDNGITKFMHKLGTGYTQYLTPNITAQEPFFKGHIKLC